MWFSQAPQTKNAKKRVNTDKRQADILKATRKPFPSLSDFTGLGMDVTVRQTIPNKTEGRKSGPLIY